MKKLIVIITVLSAVLAACGDSSDAGSDGAAPATEITESTEGQAPVTSADTPDSTTPDSTTPDSTAPTAEANSAEMVASAREDLAKRLDVDEAQVTVVAQEEIVWPNGSLGCPEEGMMYTQALVDGALLILEVDGQQYEYHGAVGEPLSYCEDPAPR